MLDVAIIGCGIAGAATAYELAGYRLNVAVLEKENDVACGATKANSAIIHAGYDPEPGTLMARLNVEGNMLAKRLCEKLDIPHKLCGSFVLAFSEGEVQILERLLENGVKNGVPDIEILPRERVLELEPGLNENVAAALHAPSAMIVSPWEYALALIETAVRNSVSLHLECKVEAIAKIDGGYRIETTGGSFEARYIVNAAGVHADEIHDMAAAPAFSIIPVRGEYYLLDKSEGSRVNRVIFQCPDKAGKGVLVAPTVHGNLIAGPNNEEHGNRGDVATTATGLAYVADKAKKSVPLIDFRANIRNFSGNRASSGETDFIIAEAKDAKGFIDLAGIKSPGLSAAPAIAKMAVQLLGQSGLELVKRESFIDTRKRFRFDELSPEEKAAAVAENPAYGRIVCRCETVTEGEILDALNAPVPPRSVDAVKRRCGAGMGRCQGGFCGPRILELLAKRLHTDPVNILQDRVGSFILTSETKKTGM